MLLMLVIALVGAVLLGLGLDLATREPTVRVELRLERLP